MFSSVDRILALSLFFFFFFNDPATTEIYTLSLHDALPIWSPRIPRRTFHGLLLRLAPRPDDLQELHGSGDGTGQLRAVRADPVRGSVPARDAGHVRSGHPHMRGGRLRLRVCNSFRVTARGGAAAPRGDLSGGRQLARPNLRAASRPARHRDHQPVPHAASPHQRTPDADQNRVRGSARYDLHAPSLHGPSDLFGHAWHQPRLRPGRGRTRRQARDCFRARLLADELAGTLCGQLDRLRRGTWLLRRATAARGQWRRTFPEPG